MSDCKKKPCGCTDHPLGTPPPCETGTITCPTGDPCPETFGAECLVYTGASIVDLGINRGERLDVIIQRLGLFITNPDCIAPNADCQSVLGLRASWIGSSSIVLRWSPSSTAQNYTVEYKEATSNTWLLNPSINQSATPTDTIAGLNSNTEYDIRVNNNCTLGGTCYSLTIRVKTN